MGRLGDPQVSDIDELGQEHVSLTCTVGNLPDSGLLELSVWIGGSTFLALIDSGAIHDFIY